MESSKPFVIDLLSAEPKMRALGERLFLAELERIRQSDFRLKANYLNINFQQYYCFTLLVKDESLIAFSGMQKPGPWHPRVARISTRLYIAPQFRPPAEGIRAYKLGQSNGETYHPNSAYLAPYQVNVARQLELTGVFITRENPRQRRNLHLMIKHFRELDPTNPRYEVLDEIVNVCPQYNSAGNFIGLNEQPSCWQNAIVLPLKPEFELGLPTRAVPT